jgi:archaellum component FlaF (FlaF/FlaG flagellin family)
MGFGNVASQMIFFIAIMGISVSLIFFLNNYVASASATMETNRQRMVESMNTHFLITNVNYFDAENITRIYLVNDGNTKLKPSDVDLYFDGLFISRTNRNISVETSTDIKDVGIWNPSETLLIEYNKSLDPATYYIDVVSLNGAKDSEYFSVE